MKIPLHLDGFRDVILTRQIKSFSFKMVKNSTCRFFYFQVFLLIIVLVYLFRPTPIKQSIKEFSVSEVLTPKPFYKHPIAFIYSAPIAASVAVKPEITPNKAGFKMYHLSAPSLLLKLHSHSVSLYSFEPLGFLTLNTLYPHHFFF